MLSRGVLGYPGVSWGNQTDRKQTSLNLDPERLISAHDNVCTAVNYQSILAKYGLESKNSQYRILTHFPPVPVTRKMQHKYHNGF